MGVVIILKHFVPKIDMWGMVQGDFRVMKKRKRSRIIWTVLFWMIFLVSVATIVYLSFQNGTSSAELGSDVIEKLAAEYYEKDTVSTTELYKFTYYFRQMGRTIAFLHHWYFRNGDHSSVFRTASMDCKVGSVSRNPAGDCMGYREM